MRTIILALFRVQRSRFLDNNNNTWTPGAKDACALPRRRFDQNNGPIISFAVRMRVLPTHALKQPSLVGQVVYPKIIGKNNSCESSYSEQSLDHQ